MVTLPRREHAARTRTVGRRLGLAGLGLALAGCAPTSVTEQGKAIYTAYNIFMWAAAVVFVVVSFLILWSIVRYRRRGDELPRQTHGNNRLELTWTVIPFLLVIFLFAVTIRTQDKALELSSRPALTVDVVAFQWSWRFAYQGSTAQVVGGPGQVPEMVVPVGQPVRIKLTSADVVHSFYVPRTLFKRQAIPGHPTEFDLTFDKVGTYHGQCAQFCGVAHADMEFRVRVVSQGEFQQWLATAARTGAPGQPGT
jgi:cytochrome c oxidase subunit 2